MPINNKSANQTWKELKAKGETTLDFLPWLKREKTKGFKNFDGGTEIPVNKPLNDSIQKVIGELHTTGGLKTKAGQDYILGIPKKVLIGAGIVAVVITAVIIYKKTRK